MHLTQILKSKNWQPLFLIMVVGIVYCPIFKNDFLYYWDDQWMVMNHYTVNGWTIENLWNLFTNFFHNQYSPFTELNYIFLFSIGGYNPFIFHLASLIWHICNTLLVWYLLKRLLKISKIGKESDRDMIAFFTAFLFGIHPMNVESVAWISAVKVLIYAFFYLLGLLAYVKYVETKKTIYYVKSMVFFICSFLGKEQAVTFPFCILLIDWWVGRKFNTMDIWVEKLSFFFVAFVLGMVTILAQSGIQGAVYPFGQRVVLSCYALFEYFTKALFPFHLNYLYPYPMDIGDALPVRFFIYPPLVAFLLYCLFMYREKKWLIFGSLLFLINLLFSINLVSMSRVALIADRYFYLSCIGIMFLLAYSIVYLNKNTKKIWIRKVLGVVCLLYVLYLGSYTFIYVTRWENTNTMKKYINVLLQERQDKEKNNYMLNY